MPKFQVGDIIMTIALEYPCYYLIEGVDENYYYWRFLGQPTFPYPDPQDKTVGTGLQRVFDNSSLEFVKVA